MARSAASPITEIRYCLFGHLPCSGAPLAGGRSPLLRTALTRSDTASRNSFKDFRSPATANIAGAHPAEVVRRARATVRVRGITVSPATANTAASQTAVAYGAAGSAPAGTAWPHCYRKPLRPALSQHPRTTTALGRDRAPGGQG